MNLRKQISAGRSPEFDALAWHQGTVTPAVAAPTGRLARLASMEFRLGGSGVKQADVAWVLDKLATTQAAGLPLHRALGMLANMRKGTPIGARLATMQQRLSDGVGFGEAISEHEEDFGPLVIALVAAGEASGSLDTALAKAAELTRSRLRLRRKIRGAMVYPASVIVITTALVAALLLYVVPKFAGIYAQAGSELPALTQAIVAASNYAPMIFGVLAAAVAALVVVVRRGRTDPKIGMAVDRVKLKLPVLGRLTEKGINARIAATLASLLASGVPLMETLQYASGVAGNRVYTVALNKVRSAVGDGAKLSDALASTGVFPELMVELTGVGEESGSLPTQMASYSAEAEDDVASAAESITSMIEPLMMVMIGGVVGTFLIALYMPIIDLSNQIK